MGVAERVGTRQIVGGLFGSRGLGLRAYYVAKCDCGEVTFPRMDVWEGSRGCVRCSRVGLVRRTRKPGAGFKHTVFNYKNGARDRGLVFELTEDEFRRLTSGNCHYCGAAPANVARSNCHDPYVYNGIDRMDNTVGYVSSNVVTCCRECNRMKGKLPFDAFLDRLRTIAERFKQNKEAP